MTDQKDPHGFSFDIGKFGFEELMSLRDAIDERLDSIRSDFINRASSMGLACSIGDNGKKKRKPRHAANAGA
jgi:hypothetical protein